MSLRPVMKCLESKRPKTHQREQRPTSISKVIDVSSTLSCCALRVDKHECVVATMRESIRWYVNTLAWAVRGRSSRHMLVIETHICAHWNVLIGPWCDVYQTSFTVRVIRTDDCPIWLHMVKTRILVSRVACKSFERAFASSCCKYEWISSYVAFLKQTNLIRMFSHELVSRKSHWPKLSPQDIRDCRNLQKTGREWLRLVES